MSTSTDPVTRPTATTPQRPAGRSARWSARWFPWWAVQGPRVATVIVVLALGAVALGAPVMSGYLTTLAISSILFAYLAQSWNIVGGYAGRFSFGHAAFFGVGAYTTAVLGADLGVSPWLSLLVGALISAVLGALLAMVSFRFGVRGPYFALSTLALAETLRVLFTNWELVGAARGRLIPFRPGSSWADLQFSSRTPYLYLVLTMVVLVTLLVRVLDRHRFGLYLQALREDETVAASLGVNCQRYAVFASALSAALTALGGAFYAQWMLFVEAPLVFGSEISIAIVVPVLLGGVGTVLGPVLGSVALAPLQEVARALFRGNPGADLVVYGLVVVVVILRLPRGIHGLFTPRHRGSGRPTGAEPTDTPPDADPAGPTPPGATPPGSTPPGSTPVGEGVAR